MPETIDVETVTTPQNTQPQTQAVQRFDGGGQVARAMTIEELRKNLQFIRDVMKQEMKEGQDYGTIPGAGPKPTLLQPGAQKLLMTFNLTERVKKETLREYPNFHREYEFTITVVAANGKEWDGVGTCSTLESKYRYRKAERRCPKCKKPTIIAEKPEFVKGREPGFVCWKKKGGCGELFHAQHPDIISQPTEDVENPDPADQWNTVRKMAFKRALVAAAINATNTSELWTQDVEDMNLDGGAPKRPQAAQDKPPPQSATSTRPAAQSATAPQKPKPAPPQNKPATPEKKFATVKTREWLVKRLEPQRDLATEYFRKLANPSVLMPNENLEDLGLEFLPVDLKQTELLEDAIRDFGNGGEVRHAYRPNELKPVEKPKEPAKPAPAPAPAPAAAAPAPAPKPAPANGNKRDPDWFWDVICPVPHKGQKRDEYLKRPDTIRSLYTQLKEGNEEAGKRLWGFANHYEPKGWNDRPPSNADIVFREALDAFLEWHEKHGEDTKGQPEPEPEPEGPRGHDYSPEPEEDDVPF